MLICAAKVRVWVVVEVIRMSLILGRTKDEVGELGSEMAVMLNKRDDLAFLSFKVDSYIDCESVKLHDLSGVARRSGRD